MTFEEVKEMNSNWKKSIIVLIGSLFITLSAAPALMAAPNEEPQTFMIEYGIINKDGSITKETFEMTETDIASLELTIRDLLDLLKGDVNLEDLMDILSNLFNGEKHPLLYKLIMYVLNSEKLANHNLVISQGWGLDLLPFQKTQTKFMKPFIGWHYQESADMLPIPSTTAVLNLNPSEVTSYTGAQFGFMFRFKGIYVHIPKMLPEQSYTFFLGTAKHIFGIEMPEIGM